MPGMRHFIEDFQFTITHLLCRAAVLDFYRSPPKDGYARE
jgi:hypothetical protein